VIAILNHIYGGLELSGKMGMNVIESTRENGTIKATP
jgi:hypothetical protein